MELAGTNLPAIACAGRPRCKPAADLTDFLELSLTCGRQNTEISNLNLSSHESATLCSVKTIPNNTKKKRRNKSGMQTLHPVSPQRHFLSAALSAALERPDDPSFSAGRVGSASEVTHTGTAGSALKLVLFPDLLRNTSTTRPSCNTHSSTTCQGHQIYATHHTSVFA